MESTTTKETRKQYEPYGTGILNQNRNFLDRNVLFISLRRSDKWGKTPKIPFSLLYDMKDGVWSRKRFIYHFTWGSFHLFMLLIIIIQFCHTYSRCELKRMSKRKLRSKKCQKVTHIPIAPQNKNDRAKRDGLVICTKYGFNGICANDNDIDERWDATCSRSNDMNALVRWRKKKHERNFPPLCHVFNGFEWISKKNEIFTLEKRYIDGTKMSLAFRVASVKHSIVSNSMKRELNSPIALCTQILHFFFCL